jgi:MipA family protein
MSNNWFATIGATALSDHSMGERLSYSVHQLRKLAAAVLVLATPSAPLLAAQEKCNAASPDCAVVGQWEISASLGFGERSNPVAGKSDIPLVVIPHISYYGKRFFLENLELGYTLHDGETHTFNIVAAPGYDRAFFYRSDLQNLFVPGGTFSAGGGGDGFVDNVNIPAEGREFPVKSRHTTYLMGPEWTFGYGNLSGQVTALREVTGRHDGYEVRAAFGAPVLRIKRASLAASAGVTWKSQELIRYYYGVDTLYEPDSALSPFIKLRYAQPLTDRWALNAFVHYEHLPGAIADSPVVSENHVTTVFAGVVFKIY